MITEGKLRSVHLPEVLQGISIHKATGILTVQGESDIIAVTFLEGEMVAADALNETLEDGLGQVLASQGLVSPEEFAKVLTEQQGLGERLVDLLLERRLLSRDQLLAALRSQTYHLLLQLLLWKEGDFKFYSGEEVSHEEGFEPIAVEELLVRSVDELGPEAVLAGELPSLDAVYEQLPNSRSIKLLGRDGEGPRDDPQAIWLSPDEKRLLDHLDGALTCEKLAKVAGLSEYKVLYGLFRLSHLGLVRLARKKPASGVASTIMAPASQRVEPSAPERPSKAPRRPPPIAPKPVPIPVEPSPTQFPSQVPAESHYAFGQQLLFWLSRGLGLGLSAALLAATLTVPSALVMPFPWQGFHRQSLEQNQRATVYRKVDRAARTFFLLEGRYPDDLGLLIERRLLAGADLQDPQGRSLAYSALEDSYRLGPIEGGEPVPGVEVAESVAGNFLLDPEFAKAGEQPSRRPVVLLD